MILLGKADAFKPAELEFIKAVYPQMGPTEIAEKLGRSKSAVKARIKRLGLQGAEACNDPPPGTVESDSASGQDRLSLLREQRGVLRNALLAASPKEIPAVSKEYRETCAEIDRLEGGDGESATAKAINAIVAKLGE